MRRLALLVLVVAVLFAILRMVGTGVLPSQVTDLFADERESDRVTVVRVTDGDTLRVRMPGGREESVRILGIDTPEVHPEVECGGAEATAALATLTPEGSTVVLVSDPTQGDRDRYDRLLRYVTRAGADVGLAQVASGRAQVFVFRDDPFRRSQAYQRAERRAQRGGHGSWAQCWR